MEENIGAYFWLNNNRCKIICLDSFSGEPHYGFETIPCKSNYNGANSGIVKTGWIPCFMVLNCEISE